MKQLTCLVMLLLVGIPSLAHAQRWAGIIDRSRAVDWSAGNQGIAGGIPNRTTICATLNPGATAAQINAAIAACPANQVVFLNAGTYNITGLNFGSKNNVTLRGAGPDRTFLKFNGADGCGGFAGDVCIKGEDVLAQTWPGHAPEEVGHFHVWTGGYAQGSTQITVDSTASLSVGMTIVLDQLDDATDTGGVLISHASTRVLENISTGRVGRGQTQWVRITAINGLTLTITPGVYMPNFRASQLPQIWWAQGPTLNGIEEMSLDHSGSSAIDAGMSGVVFWNTTQCWVKNVRSIKSGRNHVWLVQASRSEIRDNYFTGADKPGASLNYGIDFYMGGDSLVINNVFQHVTSSLLPGTTSGDILAYNFSRDQPYSSPDYMQIAVNTHDLGNLMLLVEGNQTNTFTMDLFHGAGHLNTVFRNHLSGQDVGQTTNTSVINLFAYNRFVNVVGNVLGTAGLERRLLSLRRPRSHHHAPLGQLRYGDGHGSLRDVGGARSISVRERESDTSADAARFVLPGGEAVVVGDAVGGARLAGRRPRRDGRKRGGGGWPGVEEPGEALLGEHDERSGLPDQRQGLQRQDLLHVIGQPGPELADRVPGPVRSMGA